jgi:hypothetical protein
MFEESRKSYKVTSGSFGDEVQYSLDIALDIVLFSQQKKAQSSEVECEWKMQWTAGKTKELQLRNARMCSLLFCI